MISLEQIAAANDLTLEEVQVPEWGGSVFIRTLSSAVKDRFDRLVADRSEAQAFRAILVAFAACDAHGQPAFPDSVAAAKVLEEKSALVVGRLFDVAARLNGLSAIEEAAKNSEASPT